MTTTKSLRAELRSIAKTYLYEREPELRTEEPLPEDYSFFGESGYPERTDEAVRIFEEAWADVYAEMRDADYR